MPKASTSKGRQVYRCGYCRRYHIPEASYQRPSAADKEQALSMYRKGASLRAVVRVFGANAQAVSQWVKNGGRAAQSRMRRRGPRPATVIACDEMWIYTIGAAQR